MDITVKLRLTENDEVFFGPGVRELFEQIQNTGSVMAAASQMGMSYSKAWKMIHNAENLLGETFVERKKGGADGGCAHLTESGMRLMTEFCSLENEIRVLAEDAFRRHFG